MPADTSKLKAAMDALAAEVTNTQGITASAIALIDGFAAAVTKAVTDALVDDNAADQNSVDAATAAIETTRGQFADERAKLGAAVAANSPAAPTPTP